MNLFSINASAADLSSACWPHTKLAQMQCLLISCCRTWAGFFRRWPHQAKPTRRTTFLLSVAPVVKNLRGLQTIFRKKVLLGVFWLNVTNLWPRTQYYTCKWCPAEVVSREVAAGASERRAAERSWESRTVAASAALVLHSAGGTVWVYPSQIHAGLFINGKNEVLHTPTA